MTAVSVIIMASAVYLLSGFVFALFFVIKGVDRLDESAKGAGWGFRLIIIPGTMVFWPFLLRKMIAKAAEKKYSDK
jgi:hypothetical protein